MLETHHILDVKKQQIEANLAQLFEEVKNALDGAMICLETGNRDGCDAIVRNDARINERRRLVEQDCLVAIASQQPVANDLRDIVADMRIASELERMADYASDIARLVMSMNSTGIEQLGLGEVRAMVDQCQSMLSEVERAHRNADAALARAVAATDDVLDASLKRIIDLLLAAMRGDATLVDNGTRMLWIAHNLERCGDRATNIAEQVVFRVEGEAAELN